MAQILHNYQSALLQTFQKRGCTQQQSLLLLTELLRNIEHTEALKNEKIKNDIAALERLLMDMCSRLGKDYNQIVTEREMDCNLKERLSKLLEIGNGLMMDFERTMHLFNEERAKICILSKDIDEPVGINLEKDDITVSYLKEVQLQRIELEKIKSDRCSIINDIVIDVIYMVKEIYYDESTMDDFDREILAYKEGSLGYTLEIIQKLKAKQRTTREVYEMNQSSLKCDYTNIQTLWMLLKSSEEEKMNYAKELKHLGCSKEAIEYSKKYLVDLETQKAQRMRDIIKSVQSSVIDHWDKLGVAEEDRRTISMDTSDATLRQLNNYLSDLKEKVEKAAPILSMYENRLKLLKLERELAEKMTDPDREEKLRKRVKLIPKIEKKLLEMLNEWEQENNEPFLRNGKPMKNFLTNKKAPSQTPQADKRAHQASRARTQVLKRQMTTPTGSTVSNRATPRTALKRQLTLPVDPKRTTLRVKKVLTYDE